MRFGALGDMVLLTALIRELHAVWRSPVDIVTSGPWSVPLLSGQPGVGVIHTIRSRKTPYLLAPYQWQLVRRLRLQGDVPAWFCDRGDAGLNLLARAGIPAQSIVNVHDHPLLPGEHVTEHWHRLAQLRPASWQGVAWPGKPTAHTGCALSVSDAQRADMAALLATRGLAGVPLILVQMGNKRTMRRGLRRLAVNHKHWPAERWAAVLRHIRERHPDHAIVLIGAPAEAVLNAQLVHLAAIAGLHNVAADMTVPRVVALCAQAAALLTVDSGPAHVAAAVGCPQVVLFGKGVPSMYRPLGVAGAAAHVVAGELDGTPSMLGIGVDEVIGAWDRLALRAAPPADQLSALSMSGVTMTTPPSVT